MTNDEKTFLEACLNMQKAKETICQSNFAYTDTIYIHTQNKLLDLARAVDIPLLTIEQFTPDIWFISFVYMGMRFNEIMNKKLRHFILFNEDDEPLKFEHDYDTCSNFATIKLDYFKEFKYE